MLKIIEPLRLGRRPEPFQDPNWIYELKMDGFRSLAYIEDGTCRLISRKQHELKSMRKVAESLQTLPVDEAVLDGEIVSLDAWGCPDFNGLLNRAGHICYFAFDLLWLNGEDLRREPLIKRKEWLRKFINAAGAESEARFMQHFPGHDGLDLYEVCCSRDLEGVIAKRSDSTYTEADHETAWLKIKNPNYTQAEGRSDLFHPKKKPAGKVHIPQFRCGGY
jgi:bifunctional non-homologous end joining protein LigD